MIGRVDSIQLFPILRELEEQLPIAYGLLHARYIMSPEGLNKICEKYAQKVYGTCPRVNCQGEPVLPVGLSSNLSNRTESNPVCVFCPRCREIYHARPQQNLDGAFFGPNMCHVFVDEMNLFSRRKGYAPYTHMAFGFRVRNVE
jgi:casein kinase II subunit beta